MEFTVKITTYQGYDSDNNNRRVPNYRWTCTCGKTDDGYDQENDALVDAMEHSHSHTETKTEPLEVI